VGKRNPERDTANLLGTYAGKELYGRCADCGATRRFAIAPLARKYGKLTHIAELSYRLRCQRWCQSNANLSPN
jgi:hypothetical protein